MAAISNRINTLLLLLVLFALFGVLALLATNARGGPLDPPGAPGSTDGVRDPGTPISSLPYPITQPGHYYLTRNLIGAQNLDGIVITTDHVTLDLGGFTLFGTNKTGFGVSTSGTREAIRVQNGSLEGWATALYLADATYSRVDHVTAIRNITGMQIGPNSVVANCNASFNDSLGLSATESEIHGCAIADNGHVGLLLSDENFVHANHVVHNNRVGIMPDGAGVYIAGTENRIADNYLGEQDGIAAPAVLAGSTSAANVVIRNSIRGCVNAGINNYIPVGNEPDRNAATVCP